QCVVKRMQQPPVLRVGQREAEMEPAVGERQPRQAEAKLALAGAALPAERVRVLDGRPENEAAVVAELERDAWRGDAGLGGDDEPHGGGLTGGELHALVAVVVEELRGDDARLAASPLLEACSELVGVR